MSLRRPTTICVLALLAWLAAGVSPVPASGPLYVTGPGANQPGTPYRWNLNPISYKTDLGLLGQLSNADANSLVSEAFQVWQGVTTANISFHDDGQLSENITADSYLTFVNALGNCSDPNQPTNAIIYDIDGSIVAALYGSGNENTILGFAGPLMTCANDVTGVYTRGWALLNGRFIDGQPDSASNPEISLDMFKVAFIHEFGHLLGLDHSQINLDCLDNTNACVNDGSIAGVPTMFPVLLDVSQGTLKTDDMASLSILYPAADDSFTSTMGRIQGHIFFSDGATPAQGYNVIARKVRDARITAVSNVSGYLFTPCGENTLAPTELRNCGYGAYSFPYGSHDDHTLIGFYDIPGLPPGNYTVEVEAINNSGDHPFIEGSSVGPIGQSLSFQFKMPWTAAQSTVPVSAGIPPTDTDVILLGTPPRYDAWEDGP